ncbi:ABC transporter permease [Thermosulfurimonas sp. F29]|uniref:ABC transporter permease n=1 Tax=Thermosulfurimonas sp. F29 TaxID=2867247 RepID=UPI001C83AA7F|nr:ABC transporter permease [Thermosulfurimonas sp. F29]MBX6424259.1 ABC transporter permease [Thermosulfurimonas sp. F29]
MKTGLLKSFIKREIKSYIAGSILGPVLFFLQPFLQIVTYLFLFQWVFKVKIHLMGREEDFLRFFLAGYIPWSWHAEGVGRGGGSLVHQAHLITKIRFPTEVLPMASTCASYLMGLAALPLLLAIMAYREGVHGIFLFCPILVVPGFLITLASVLFVSAVSVYIRDLLQMIPLFLTLWFYATPVLYTREMLPPKLRFLCALNPYTPVVEAWQRLLILREFPWREILLSSAEGAVLLSASYLLFSRLKKGFPDVL